VSGARSSTRTRWGWHRLTDDWASRLVLGARVRPGDTVLDVGAGDGAITAALVEAGARVIAVELHPHRLAELHRRFDADPAVRVVRADAARLRLPRRPFRVVANPPFSVTSPLLRRLLVPGAAVTAIDVVLQRDAARRWADGATAGAARWCGEFDVRVGGAVPRRAFRPRPTVDAAILVVRRRAAREREVKFGPRAQSHTDPPPVLR
jgi:23S rRNA (adenine-N6)-dimethyltransferase